MVFAREVTVASISGGIKRWRHEVNCQVFKDVQAGAGGGGRMVRIMLILFWGRNQGSGVGEEDQAGGGRGNPENPVGSR